MEYREKVRIAEAAIVEIEAGSSLEEIKERMQNEGYKQEDIYAVSGSVRKQISQKYEGKIKSLIEEGREAEIKSEIPHLPEDDLADLVERVKSQRNKAIVYKVRSMRNDGTGSAEILTYLATQHLSGEEIQTIVEKAVNDGAEQSDQSASSMGIYMILGIALIAGGILLSMNTGRIFYGAIVVGLGIIFKGFF